MFFKKHRRQRKRKEKKKREREKRRERKKKMHLAAKEPRTLSVARIPEGLDF